MSAPPDLEWAPIIPRHRGWCRKLPFLYDRAAPLWSRCCSWWRRIHILQGGGWALHRRFNSLQETLLESLDVPLGLWDLEVVCAYHRSVKGGPRTLSERRGRGVRDFYPLCKPPRHEGHDGVCNWRCRRGGSCEMHCSKFLLLSFASAATLLLLSLAAA